MRVRARHDASATERFRSRHLRQSSLIGAVTICDTRLVRGSFSRARTLITRISVRNDSDGLTVLVQHDQRPDAALMHSFSSGPVLSSRSARSTSRWQTLPTLIGLSFPAIVLPNFLQEDEGFHRAASHDVPQEVPRATTTGRELTEAACCRLDSSPSQSVVQRSIPSP